MKLIYKRRKRFGASILKHAPASFVRMLEAKFLKYGGMTAETDIKEYRASQYNHMTGEYKKPELSERTKLIGGKN